MAIQRQLIGHSPIQQDRRFLQHVSCITSKRPIWESEVFNIFFNIVRSCMIDEVIVPLPQCAPLTPNYHPPSRLYRGNFDLQCFRNIATGLIYVSSKPLDLPPDAPATKAINKLMKETTGQLQTYYVIYDRTQIRSRGLTLFLIVDFAHKKSQFAQLQPLPPQTRESVNSENKAEAYDEPPAEETPDTKSPELPPELQPVLQKSGLPGPSKDLIRSHPL